MAASGVTEMSTGHLLRFSEDAAPARIFSFLGGGFCDSALLLCVGALHATLAHGEVGSGAMPATRGREWSGALSHPE